MNEQLFVVEAQVVGGWAMKEKQLGEKRRGKLNLEFMRERIQTL